MIFFITFKNEILQWLFILTVLSARLASVVRDKKECSLSFFSLFKSLMFSSDIDMLEEFAYLRTQEGGKIHLELLPNQAMLIK